MTGLRSSFRHDLDDLLNTVLRMGTFADSMLSRAMQALLNQDLELAREVHRSDDVADDFDFQIEKASISLLCSQQPVSGDLRGILGALRIATDLERIADYSKDIAKVAIKVGSVPWFAPLEDTERMGALAGELLRLALRALADGDLELARVVAARDEELDDLWHKLWDDLARAMQNDPSVVPQAMHLVVIARYLERIGDHTVNIMERLNYMQTGKLEDLA